MGQSKSYNQDKFCQQKRCIEEIFEKNLKKVLFSRNLTCCSKFMILIVPCNKLSLPFYSTPCSESKLL